MSLTDLYRKKRNRPVEGADPSLAFGAEEMTMEEFRRQNFIPPEEKAPSFAQKAGAALSSLRSRIVGEEPVDEFSSYQEPERSPVESAPVYSAQNYQDEGAPDLGWEAAFSEQPRKPKAAPRRRVVNEAPPAYEEYVPEGYAPAYAREPVYGSAYPYQDGYNYDPEFYGGAPRYAAPYPPQYAPQPEWNAQGYAAPEGYYTEGYAEEGYYYNDGAWYDADDMPPPRRSYRQRIDPGDLRYLFWSGGIVLGMVLTAFSFIYACFV